MDIAEGLARFLASFVQTIKSESIDWQKQNQPELLKLKEEKLVGEQRIKQRLQEMEDRFQEHRQRVKAEETRKTQQFQDYLNSIDDLKQKILQYYPQMPKPLALMIHHRATQLLTRAWHDADALKRTKGHQDFFDLMVTVTYELGELEQLADSKGKMPILPKKTIDLIRMDLS